MSKFQFVYVHTFLWQFEKCFLSYFHINIWTVYFFSHINLYWCVFEYFIIMQHYCFQFHITLNLFFTLQNKYVCFENFFFLAFLFSIFTIYISINIYNAAWSFNDHLFPLCFWWISTDTVTKILLFCDRIYQTLLPYLTTKFGTFYYLLVTTLYPFIAMPTVCQITKSLLQT